MDRELAELAALRDRLPEGDWRVEGRNVLCGDRQVATTVTTPQAAYVATACEHAPRIAERLRETAALALRLYMEHLSWRYADERWAPGLERALWQAVVDGPVRLDAEEVDRLSELAALAGGWFAWEGDEPEFLDAEAWRSRYAEES